MHCSSVFLSRDKDAKYCTRKCYYDDRFGVTKVRNIEPNNAWKDKTCPYNQYVCCQEQKCDKCGWNPKVEKARMARYQRVIKREVAEHG